MHMLDLLKATRHMYCHMRHTISDNALHILFSSMARIWNGGFAAPHLTPPHPQRMAQNWKSHDSRDDVPELWELILPPQCKPKKGDQDCRHLTLPDFGIACPPPLPFPPLTSFPPSGSSFALQLALTSSLTQAEQASAAAREADQAAGASAAQLASRQAQEQVSSCNSLPSSPFHQGMCSVLSTRTLPEPL